MHDSRITVSVSRLLTRERFLSVYLRRPLERILQRAGNPECALQEADYVGDVS